MEPILFSDALELDFDLPGWQTAAVADTDGVVHQNDLDSVGLWSPALKNFTPSRKFTAYFFDDVTGGVINVETNSSDDSQPSAYGSLFHFLGFLVLNEATLPFFTDKHILRSQLDYAHLSLAGFIKKPLQTVAVPVYCESTSIIWLQGNLSSQSIGGVFITTDHQYTGGARTFTLQMDDMQFQPWDLCTRTIFFPFDDSDHRHAASSSTIVLRTELSDPLVTSQHVLAVKRPRIDSVGEVSPYSTKKSKGPDSDTDDGKLSLDKLQRTFPSLHAFVLKGKVYYRCQCLLRLPYLQSVGKLALADEAFISVLAGEVWETDNTPPRAKLLRLILAEHSTFRSNSVSKAEEVVQAEFPATGPGAMDVQQVAEILRTLFLTENNPNMPLSDAVDNCFALRAVGQALAQGVVRPFAHGMIGRLLMPLFMQRMRHSRNIPLRDNAEVNLVGQPVPVVPVIYAISLIVDAIINTFRTRLATAGVSIPNIASSTFDVDADGLKFQFFLGLWERLEQSTEYGAQMLETRQIWGNGIFV